MRLWNFKHWIFLVFFVLTQINRQINIQCAIFSWFSLCRSWKKTFFAFRCTCSNGASCICTFNRSLTNFFAFVSFSSNILNFSINSLQLNNEKRNECNQQIAIVSSNWFESCFYGFSSSLHLFILVFHFLEKKIKTIENTVVSCYRAKTRCSLYPCDINNDNNSNKRRGRKMKILFLFCAQTTR